MERKSIENLIFGFIVAIFSIYFIWYGSNLMVEVPFLSFIDQIPLADKFLSDNLHLRDCLTKYVEHGMFGTNLLYLINVRFFHGIQMFDVYMNDLIVIATGLCFAQKTKRTINPKYFFPAIIAEFVFLFTVLQGTAIGMDVQVKSGLLFFCIASILVDEEFHSAELKKTHFLATLFLIFVSINIFGTFYSFAGIPFVFFIFALSSLKDKKIQKRPLIIALAYLFCILLYLKEYHIMQTLNAESGGMRKNFISIFTNPLNTIGCILSWYANGVFGWAFHESESYTPFTWLFWGGAVFSATVYSVVLFIKSKMYEKTWLPLMCIVYTFGVLVLVYLGRQSHWDYSSNEWYNVHIKVSLASSVWIFVDYISGTLAQNKWKSILSKSKLASLANCTVSFILGGGYVNS